MAKRTTSTKTETKETNEIQEENNVPSLFTIKSNWPDRYVIPGDVMPSGLSYIFEPNGVLHGIPEDDKTVILSIRRSQGGCCGNGPRNLMEVFSIVTYSHDEES